MKLSQKMGLKGIHKIIHARISCPEAQEMHDKINSLQEKGDRTWKELLCEFNTRFGIMTRIVENVTPTVGRTIIAKAMSGYLSTLADVQVNYVALGTASTAPAITDTQLGTELYRKLISSMSYTNSYFYGTAFYAAGQGTGTLKEHGLFIAGTASANSGSIISHLLTGTIVKGALDTLTIETEIQINDT